MFYEGEVVRSHFHGLGQVVRAGEDPTVRFLDGQECEAPGDTLTAVPEEIFFGAIDNRRALERYLHRKVYGYVDPDFPPLPPKKRFNLVAAIRKSTLEPQLPPPEPRDDGSLLFIADDLNRGSAADSGPRDGRDIERVEVQRVELEIEACSLRESGRRQKSTTCGRRPGAGATLIPSRACHG